MRGQNGPKAIHSIKECLLFFVLCVRTQADSQFKCCQSVVWPGCDNILEMIALVLNSMPSVVHLAGPPARADCNGHCT